MPNIRLTDTECQAIAQATNAYNPKAAKKAVWQAVRNRLGLSSNLKFGVECDPSCSGYAMLYVKGTDPREYVQDQVGVPVRTAQAGPYVTIDAGPDSSTVFYITKPDLLNLLRDCDYAYRAEALPTGFPTMNENTVVLDNRDGTLYFRA